MMGKCSCLETPSDSQIFSAKVIVDIFKEARCFPDGVINVDLNGDPVMITGNAY